MNIFLLNSSAMDHLLSEVQRLTAELTVRAKELMASPVKRVNVLQGPKGDDLLPAERELLKRLGRPRPVVVPRVARPLDCARVDVKALGMELAVLEKSAGGLSYFVEDVDVEGYVVVYVCVLGLRIRMELPPDYPSDLSNVLISQFDGSRFEIRCKHKIFLPVTVTGYLRHLMQHMA